MHWLRTKRITLLVGSVIAGSFAVLLLIDSLGRAFSASSPLLLTFLFYGLLLCSCLLLLLGVTGTVLELRAQHSWRPVMSLIVGTVGLVLVFSSPFVGLALYSYRESYARRNSEKPISKSAALELIRKCRIESMSLFVEYGLNDSTENGPHARLFYKNEYIKGGTVADAYQDADPEAWSAMVNEAEAVRERCGEVRAVVTID